MCISTKRRCTSDLVAKIITHENTETERNSGQFTVIMPLYYCVLGVYSLKYMGKTKAETMRLPTRGVE